MTCMERKLMGVHWNGLVRYAKATKISLSGAMFEAKFGAGSLITCVLLRGKLSVGLSQQSRPACVSVYFQSGSTPFAV